jgi:proteasome accessory factor C
MSTVARDRIRRCLAMIPLIRARPGIRVPELASIFGVRDEEIWEDITEVLTLCGVPPYLPHNYLVFSIHGDRVRISFAEHLSRPVHLTLQEALAIDLALRTVSGGRPPAFGAAAPRLRDKLRSLLGGQDRKALEAFDRGVAGTPPPDVVTETIGLLKHAMARNVCVQIDYWTASRDRVTYGRVIEPYALVDHRGKWYVVARDHTRGRELPFRVDRIREALLLPGTEYEVPDRFTAEEYRRDELWKEGPDDVEVQVAFSPAVAARMREGVERRRLRELADGGVVRTYRIQRGRPRWLYTQVARLGGDAEILGPPDVRRGMAAFLDSILGAAPATTAGRGPSAPVVRGPEDGAQRPTATAAARPRPARPRTRRKPPAKS